MLSHDVDYNPFLRSGLPIAMPPNGISVAIHISGRKFRIQRMTILKHKINQTEILLINKESCSPSVRNTNI